VKPVRNPFLILSGTCLLTLASVFLISQSPQAAEKLNKEEVQAIVREYLKSNPEIVIEAIETYQSNQQEIDARRFKDVIAQNKDALHGGDFPFAGNPDANVTVVEFFDYNCGYCKRALGDVQKVLEKDKNVKFVFHEMPILSEQSGVAARYALAAHKQGKYFEYHQAVMSHSGSKDAESLGKIAQDIGLDIEKLHKDADSAEIRASIEESSALARKIGINGTPAFIVGDQLVPGYIPYDEMIKMIEKVRNNEG